MNTKGIFLVTFGPNDFLEIKNIQKKFLESYFDLYLTRISFSSRVHPLTVRFQQNFIGANGRARRALGRVSVIMEEFMDLKFTGVGGGKGAQIFRAFQQLGPRVMAAVVQKQRR